MRIDPFNDWRNPKYRSTDGVYVVRAEQLKRAANVQIEVYGGTGEEVQAAPGDWRLRLISENGNANYASVEAIRFTAVMTDDDFREMFEPLTDEVKAA